MEMNRTEKDMPLKDVLDSFIKSYAQRDTGVAFPDWFSDKLRQELPGIEPEASARLANGIIEAVAGYDQRLQDLNQAVEAGFNREEWLSEKLTEASDGMPLNAVGESLQRMEAGLIASNMQIRGETGQQVFEGTSAEAESAEWNEHSIAAEIGNIPKLLDSVAFGAASSALEKKLNEDKTEASDAVKDAFQNGMEDSPDEVKAVIAGAVRAAAEKGFEKILPIDTPIEVIGDFAGAAVEAAKALYDAADGKISMNEALDRMGRAGVSAYCRAGAVALNERLMKLPLGPIWVDLLGGLLDHMKSPQFIENVYRTVRDAAKATWEGIKNSKVVKVSKKIFDMVKQKLPS